jgi:hypothetical protein
MSLYTGTFEIKDVKKNFDKVSRIYDTKGSLELDVHDMFFEFFKNSETKKFNMELAINGGKISNSDYSMHGTIYKIDDSFVHVSFGGLLMKLKTKIPKVMLDKEVFCFINTV